MTKNPKITIFITGNIYTILKWVVVFSWKSFFFFRILQLQLFIHLIPGLSRSQVKGVLQMGESTDPSAPVRFNGVVYLPGGKKNPSSKSCFFFQLSYKGPNVSNIDFRGMVVLFSKTSTKNQLPSPNMFPGLPNNSCIKTITPTHILPPQNCVCYGNLNDPPPMRPSPRNKGPNKALFREN